MDQSHISFESQEGEDFVFQNHLQNADLYFQSQDIDNALRLYFEALKINQSFNLLKSNTFHLFCSHKITPENKEMMKQICEYFLQSNDINHNPIFSNALLLSKFKYNESRIDPYLFKKKRVNPEVSKVIDDKIFQLLIKNTLIKDYKLEKFLTIIRKEFLKQYFINKNSIQIFKNFMICLAEQCFLNEYIFKVSKYEENKLLDLEKYLNKKVDIDEYEILLISLYKSLNSVKSIQNKIKGLKNLSPNFMNFLKFTFFNCRKEELLKKQIKSLSKIKNKVSLLMQSQYEDNPYPRWRYADIPDPKDLRSFLSSILPYNFNHNNKQKNILIAGCGTGQQIVSCSKIENTNIYAIDLSMKSLSYAKRQINELNINNVNFYHLDILNLKLLKKKFDLIICSGCLHHMEKPILGLKELISVLKPNGVMNIGLYSKKARESVKIVRDYISRNNFTFNKENISKVRDKIIESKNPKLRILTESCDFFSTSCLRDLLFNSMEHTYSLIDVKKEINNLKLKFLGFDYLTNGYMNLFKKLNPHTNSELDLNLWDRFEKTYPETFIGMYDFWVSKKVKELKSS